MNAVLLLLTIAVMCCGSSIEDWGRFEQAVRDQRISKPEAHAQFGQLVKSLFDTAAGMPFSHNARWTFPVAGYAINDVGKGGFLPDIRYGTSPIKGYDFFDGNLHGGHPAYDIFIRDSNMDNLDDRSGKAAEVVAPVDLLVLSIDTGWTQGSALRGGNYLWALSAPDSLMFYFAHLDRIVVLSGQFCKAGTPVGTVGRTGANAAAKRSPTHLHLMVLKIRDGLPVPFDSWHNLYGR